METLKKLQPLAKTNDWCIRFDLEDGYHIVGIDPAFQEYMQFEMRGRIIPGVVAMLFHFTSRSLELMRWMRCLWILLDLNDIELFTGEQLYSSLNVAHFHHELSKHDATLRTANCDNCFPKHGATLWTANCNDCFPKHGAADCTTNRDDRSPKHSATDCNTESATR
ncbi:hypothetical protein CYMTET_2624 [Cymbomonas tetramitiformis]|uniref:Uncharacterized protein n=1 Tax=Cymbomonas tetramitiformis TaxID=36881 RepID=A0AAE0LM49_9CHLO|nr:hypothetical protein CYMTET_2624 [Cymbomonas tetramitiformis]